MSAQIPQRDGEKWRSQAKLLFRLQASIDATKHVFA